MLPLRLLRTAGPASLIIALAMLLVFVPSPAAAQQIQVTAADPPAAEQGTVNLNVRIKGKGFKNGARAEFLVSGTTNPGGIVVKSTTFVSATELIANIDIADTADLAKFDIKVTVSGRVGKGTELFSVVVKGSLNGGSYDACTQRAILAPRLEPQLGYCSASGSGCLDLTFGTGGLVATNTTGDTRDQSGWSAALQHDPLSGQFRILVGGDNYPVGPAVVGYTLAGELDTSFGSGGLALVASSTGASDYVRAIAVQPDGKLLVIWGGVTFRISRLQSNGAVDTSFGANGHVSVDFGKRVPGYPRGMALQKDGKVLVVGDAGAHWGIVRLNLNGSLDPAFGNAGKVVFNATGSNRGSGSAFAVVLQEVSGEDRIVVSGSAAVGGAFDYGLARFRSDGAIDTSFGTAGTGVVTVDFFGFDDIAMMVELDATNRIVVAGYSETDDCMAAHVFSVARFEANGVPDTSFGDSDSGGLKTGKTSVNVLAGEDRLRAFTHDSLGRLLLAGTVRTESPGSRFGVVRLLGNGALDSSFGDRGAALATFGGMGSESPHGVVIDPTDGGVILGGWAYPTANKGHFAVAKFTP